MISPERILGVFAVNSSFLSIIQILSYYRPSIFHDFHIPNRICISIFARVFLEIRSVYYIGYIESFGKTWKDFLCIWRIISKANSSIETSSNQGV